MGLSDKKPRPSREMSPKLFAGGSPTTGAAKGGNQAKKSIELKNSEAGLVRSTDVFNSGQAFGGGEKSAPIVDWDAMAAHARDANRPRSYDQMFAEIFSRNGRYHLISRPILIALVSGIIGGIFVSIFSYYTDRIPYRQYSDKGDQLLHQKEARPAVEYFLSQSNRAEQDTWSGSPNHVASLEGLAQAYANDKCYASADETFNRVIGLLRNNRFHDDVRLVSALEHYGDFLSGQKRDLDARAIRSEVRRLQDHNTGGHWIWFFAIITFVFEAIYMTGVLLSDAKKLQNWPVYAGFSLMGMLGMTVGMFLLGLPIWGALAISMTVAYAIMPFVLGASCALGKSMPAFHVLLPSSKRK